MEPRHIGEINPTPEVMRGQMSSNSKSHVGENPNQESSQNSRIVGSMGSIGPFNRRSKGVTNSATSIAIRQTQTSENHIQGVNSVMTMVQLNDDFLAELQEEHFPELDSQAFIGYHQIEPDASSIHDVANPGVNHF